MQAAALWLFWPPPSCSGSIPGTCPCKSGPNQAPGSTAATKPLRLDPQTRLASDRRTPTGPLRRRRSVIDSLPPSLPTSLPATTGTQQPRRPVPPNLAFYCVCEHVEGVRSKKKKLIMRIGVQLQADHRGMRRHKRACRSSFSSTAARLLLASPQSDWHQDIPAAGRKKKKKLLPRSTSTPNIHTAHSHSHNYRFLLDVSVSVIRSHQLLHA